MSMVSGRADIKPGDVTSAPISFVAGAGPASALTLAHDERVTMAGPARAVDSHKDTQIAVRQANCPGSRLQYMRGLYDSGCNLREALGSSAGNPAQPPRCPAPTSARRSSLLSSRLPWDATCGASGAQMRGPTVLARRGLVPTERSCYRTEVQSALLTLLEGDSRTVAGPNRSIVAGVSPASASGGVRHASAQGDSRGDSGYHAKPRRLPSGGKE